MMKIKRGTRRWRCRYTSDKPAHQFYKGNNPANIESSARARKHMHKASPPGKGWWRGKP